MTAISIETAPVYASALEIPWVPVTLVDGKQTRLGLLGLFEQAHEVASMGRDLTPIERESLHRFLPTVAAVILADADDNALDEVASTGRFPQERVDAFAAAHKDSFWLRHPDRPFLQRHDIVQADVYSLVTSKRVLVGEDPRTSVSRPLTMLHPHVPGGSSNKWAVRHDGRDPAADLGVLTLLLVVTWWQTRRGNGVGPDGRTLENGNPGQAGIRPLSAHWIGPNLGLTIAAGLPEEWIDSDEQPMWLDRDNAPRDLSSNPHGLWRTTYARNVPLVIWGDEGSSHPVSFALGPTTSPVPTLAATEKASLVAIHNDDYARLFQTIKKTNKPTEYKQVNTGDARLASTEGYVRWYSNHLDEALKSWRDAERLAQPNDTWKVGVYSEICHTTGSREYSDWVVLPTKSLAPSDDAAAQIATAVTVITELARRMYSPMTIACEGRRYKDAEPVALSTAKARFYALVEKPLVEFIEAAATDLSRAEPDKTAEEFRRLALLAFNASTQPLVVPATLPQVSVARSSYAHASRAVVDNAFKPQKSTTKKPKATTPTQEQDFDD